MEKPLEETKHISEIQPAAHPQTDGLTEVVNRSVGGLLRALITQNPGGWKRVPSMAEFAYNSSANRTTGKSPFEIVYGKLPKQVTDLIDDNYLIKGVEDMIQNIKTVQKETVIQIECNTTKYKEEVDRHRKVQDLHVGDWVMVRTRKERFPPDRHSKLRDRRFGPCQIMEKINDNTFKIELPDSMEGSSSFNVKDLTKFFPLDLGHYPHLWSSAFREGATDVTQPTMMVQPSIAEASPSLLSTRYKEELLASKKDTEF